MASNIVSLDQFRQKKNLEKKNKKITGILVWLNCPNCKTIEYTPVRAPYGRTHRCGTQVDEQEVEIDLRAEKTIAELNLDIIEKLQADNKNGLKKIFNSALSSLTEPAKKAELVYLEKIKIANQNQDFESYLEEINLGNRIIEDLPIVEKNMLGLYISDFRHRPEKRFSKKE